MDPVTAIGLVSAILSFVTFSTKLVKGTIEIHDAVDGTLEDNRSREAIAMEMKRFTARLLPPDDAQLAGEEKELCALATECRALSTQLLDLLGRIKPKDASSKRQALWAALKNKLHETEKEDLEQRLDYCRSQLELQLSFLSSRQTRSSLEELVKLAKDDAAKLKRLQANLDQLSDGVQLTSISAGAQAQIRALVSVQEEALRLIVENRIINSLKFQGMYGRYDSIDDAHLKTFRWIYDEDDTAAVDDDRGFNDRSDENQEADFLSDDETLHEQDRQESGDETNDGVEEAEIINAADTSTAAEEVLPASEDEGKEATTATKTESESEYSVAEKYGSGAEQLAKRMASETFTRWLESGDGIFHISGKLGSGKSTLMKYLGDHPATRERLEKWAGHRTLVTGQFYFWRPGTELQKSLSGLYRSLLHETIRICPELIPEVLPAYWKLARAAPWHIQAETLDIPEKDIRLAFSRIIKSKSVFRKHCLCFFIDGLDEYQETAQRDYKEMVELLCSWTRISSKGIKLCVSSREYNVFMNAFLPQQRLRLHDLTQFDIIAYVRDKLSYLPDIEKYQELIRTIVERAQGIFLWVTLVVKSIRDQLENGARTDTLMELVNSLPDELDSLYTYIFKSMNKVNRRRAYRTFRMILLKTGYGIPISTLGYSFFEDWETNSNYICDADFTKKALQGTTMEQRTQLGRKLLNGWTAGLVEPVDSDIGFTHRSLPDYLDSAEMKADMAPHFQQFDAADAISQLVLADRRVRFEPAIYSDEDNLGRLTGNIAKMRTECNSDREPYEFLDAWDAHHGNPFIEDIVQGKFDIWTEDLDITLPKSNKAAHIIGTTYSQENQSGRSLGLSQAIYQCAWYGFDSYPVWKIYNDPTATDDLFKVTLLAYTAMVSLRFGAGPNYAVLTALIDKGLLSAPFSTTPKELSERRILQDEFKNESATSRTTRLTPIGPLMHLLYTADVKSKSTDLTIWQHYLVSEYLVRCGAGLRDNETNFKMHDERFGELATRFLKHGGVDPRFKVNIRPAADSTSDKPKLDADIYLGGDDGSSEAHAYQVKVKVEEKKIPRTSDQWRQKVTDLRSWVEALEGDTDKGELLRLVDEAMRSVERGGSAAAEQEEQEEGENDRIEMLGISELDPVAKRDGDETTARITDVGRSMRKVSALTIPLVPLLFGFMAIFLVYYCGFSVATEV